MIDFPSSSYYGFFGLATSDIVCDGKQGIFALGFKGGLIKM